MTDDSPLSPGAYLSILLRVRGWTQRVLAIVLGVDDATVTRLVTNKQPIDADLALVLGDVFDVDAERFLELQRTLDLGRARRAAQPDPARAKRAALFGQLPIAEMIRRRWLDADDIRDIAAVEASLMKFFGVSSADDIEIMPHAAKRTNVVGETTPTQLTWLYRVKQIASEMVTRPYSPRALTAAVENDLRPLLVAPEAARKVPMILSDAGVRFVIVESLAGAKIDGVAFWLNDLKPVIGMSLRFDRIDNFWFVLRHEIEHLLRRHGKGAMVLDADLEGERAGDGPTVAGDERVANAAAAEFCVPQASLNRFIANKAPFFPERDLLGFARTVQVHPGLIAGQIRHRTDRYDRFKQHMAKIRSCVIQSAIVDGWGDVVPVGE